MFFGGSHLRRVPQHSQTCRCIWAAGRVAEGGAGEGHLDQQQHRGHTRGHCNGQEQAADWWHQLSWGDWQPARELPSPGGPAAPEPVSSVAQGCDGWGKPVRRRGGAAIGALDPTWGSWQLVRGDLGTGAGDWRGWDGSTGGRAGEAPGHDHMDRSCRAAACCLKPNPLRNECPWVQTRPLLLPLGRLGVSGPFCPCPQISPQSLGAEAENAAVLDVGSRRDGKRCPA